VEITEALLLQMYGTFPDGWPGAGLLLLRAAAGVGLIVQGVAYFGNEQRRGMPFVGIAALMFAVGALLLIGCLTRYVAVVAAAAWVGIFPLFPGPNVGLFETRMTATFALVIAVAVVCLGPGAFSVDARLFGRREIIIPKNPHNADI
jgi:uncharacterized membrane protein YphA (DoxX/SURF4 family)